MDNMKIRISLKRVLLVMVITTLTVISAYAQPDSESRRLSIIGQLFDAELKEPMMQATIQLFQASDSTFAGGTVSNEKGSFYIEVPRAGTYKLRISSVGYQTLERELTLRRNEQLDLGDLVMETESTMLKETVITGRAAQVIVRKDTIMYNPEAFRTPEGSAIEELIKRIPGAEVDEDGNITINGKEVKKILLDGKEFMLGDVETALKNIPVSIIQNLKFYDQQSDQSRITGIEDGEKETVLDFSIKKGMNRGYMTNLDLAAGTKHRYATRGMATSFTDKTRIVLLGNFNNKEENAGWWNRRGLNARKMLGTNLNYDDNKKLKVDFSIRWNHRDGDNQTETAAQNFYSETLRTFTNSNTSNFTRSNNWRGNLRLEWKPDTLTNILVRANGTYGTDDATTTSASATFDDDPFLYAVDPLAEFALPTPQSSLIEHTINYDQNANMSYGLNKNAWAMIQLYRRLNPRGRNIMLRLEGSIGDNQNENVSDNEVHLFRVKNRAGQDSTYYTARYNTTPSDNNGYVLSTTYSEPLWKGAHLQFNYELRYNKNKSNRQTFDFSHLPENPFAGIIPEYRDWDTWIGENSALASYHHPLSFYLDRSLSRFSEYKNYTHNLRLTLRHNEEKYDYNIGFLVQPQRSDFVQDYRGIYVDTMRIVTNLTPTVNFHYKFSDQSNLWIRYRGDTRQPEMTQLLDIRDDSNPLYITVGNPGLKPQFTNSLNVYYNNYIVRYKRSIVLYGNYRHIRNSISDFVVYDPETGARTSRPENINGNWNLNAGLTFNTALDSTAHWNIGTDTRLRYNNFVSYVAQDKADAAENTTRSYNLNQRLSFGYRNDWLEITLDGNVTYQHSRNELQPTADLDTWLLHYGGQFLVRLPYDFEISMNLHERSRRGYNDATMNTNELLWNGQISKPFLKNKSLIIALNFYDLLGQQSNYERWVNASGRTDTRYNSVNSYAMLHVRYRLNIFAGKIDTEGHYDKKWGSRDNNNRGGGGRRW